MYAYTPLDDARRYFYLVYEFAEKGSLDSFWKADLGPERLSLFRRRIQIALDVLTAIQFLHIGTDQVPSSFHGNIKSASIVLKRDFTAQLIDCGLANIVVGRNESPAKASLSHDAAGGMHFEHCFDIFSFGVVLAELLTGRVQSHEDYGGASFNFETQYAEHKSDSTEDRKMNLDPALGYGTWALPNYVKDFADLARCCMQPKSEDRPTGEAILEKLVEILSLCCARNSDSCSGIPVGDSVPQRFELKSQDKCKICRTFAPVSPQSVCEVCKSAAERRAQVSFWGESRQNVAAAKDALLPLLSRFDIRLNHPVPRLFIIVPLAFKSGLKDPNAWLRNPHRTRYFLYFVCSHSMKAIQPPVPMIVTKCWLESVAPVLAMSLYLLHTGLPPGGCIDLDFGDTPIRLSLNSIRIAEMLETVSEILTETGNYDVLSRLRRNEELDTENIRLLNGDSYELIVERAVEERGWRDRMEPVRKNGSPQIFWVSKDVASDSSNGYEIVQV